jgi:holin-like protein
MKVVRCLSALYLHLRHPLQVVCGIAAICLLFVLAGRLDARLGITLPAGVVGMAVLLLLLIAKIVPLRYVRPGANWLLAEMLLFFVPAFVGIVRYLRLLSENGFRILLAVALGTICVLVSTAVAVDLVHRLERGARLRTLRRTRGEQLRPNLEDLV